MEKFRRGFYYTTYGNVAYVSSRAAKTAFDVDMGERIPISQVRLDRFCRPGKNRRD